MLLPALGRAKSRAQQISCVNNMKQLTLAGLMYVNDTSSFVDYQDPLNNALWMGNLINFYAKVDNIRICPAAVVPDPVVAGPGACDKAWAWTGTTKIFTGSYAINAWLYNGGWQAGYTRATAPVDQWAFKKLHNVRQVSSTPFFVDCPWVDLFPWETDPPVSDLYTAGGTSNPGGLNRAFIPRHGWKSARQAPTNFNIQTRMPGSVSIGFVDGHAEAVKIETLWNYTWHKDWQAPAKRPGLP